MDGIATLLWADAGFRAASPGGIMPTVLPQRAALPATTWMVAGGSSSPTFETSGLQKLRIQFDHHASDQAGANAARNALRNALEGYRGTLTDGTFLQWAEWLQPLDFFDNEPRQFRCAQEFYLYFTLTTAVYVAPTISGADMFTLIAAVNLSQGLGLAVNASGLAVLADSGNIAQLGEFLGVCVGSTVASGQVSIQYKGQLTYNGWSWTLGVPIFLGAGGVLTQIPPTAGFLQEVGIPLSANSMLIQIADPIHL
jgi:hypothetical protein